MLLIFIFLSFVENRHPKILDQKIELKDYQQPIRQIVINELGREEPIFLLTNQLKRSASKLIQHYAQRMIIKNGIEDSIDFFYMGALSSAVAMKVNLDVQLTLMASSLYRLFASKIGNRYQKAKLRHIFRDFIYATANIMITDREVIIKFQKRSHNPFLIAAGFNQVDVRIPWFGKKTLQFILG